MFTTSFAISAEWTGRICAHTGHSKGAGKSQPPSHGPRGRDRLHNTAPTEGSPRMTASWRIAHPSYVGPVALLTAPWQPKSFTSCPGTREPSRSFKGLSTPQSIRPTVWFRLSMQIRPASSIWFWDSSRSSCNAALPSFAVAGSFSRAWVCAFSRNSSSSSPTCAALIRSEVNIRPTRPPCV